MSWFEKTGKTNAEDARVSLRARRVTGFHFAGFVSLYLAGFAFCFSLKGVDVDFLWNVRMSWRRERRFWDCLFFICEDGFDGAVEEASEFEG